MRTTRTVTALLAAAVVLVGCSAGDSDDAAMGTGAATEDAGDTAGDEPAGRQADGGEAAAGDDSAGGGLEAAINPTGATAGRAIIREASVELAVEDPERAVQQLTDLVDRRGGFVSSADLFRDEDGALRGTLTVRLPADTLDRSLQDIEALAEEVRSRTISSEDVTERLSDIGAQLRNLRALEVELLDLLSEIRDRSDSAEEILRVFAQIRQVREEIEILEGRRTSLEDLVALATVRVELVPVSPPAPLTADEQWRPGDVASRAWATTVAALQNITDAAIWIVLTVLPVVLIVLAPVALAWGLWRMRRDRHADASA